MPDTVLSPLERRITGNLSIPRNVDDLLAELRADPHARNPAVREGDVMRPGAPLTADQVDEELRALEEAGLVTNLGSHENLAKLAAGLERRRGARAMHDDKAAIYVERLAAPRRAWRGEGDLWLYTDAAHELLTGPVPGIDPGELDKFSLELLIAAEADRVAHELELKGSVFDLESYPGAGDGGGQLAVFADGGDPDVDTRLAGRLLAEEFRAWQDAVIAAHFERTGERVSPIIAGGSYGDATELLVLTADSGGASYGETSPTYLAATTVAITDADTGTTITRATYTGYADKSIASTDFATAAAGSHTTSNAITWAGATAGTSTVIGVGRVTTLGGGRLIRRATVASTIVSATNTPLSIAAGSYTDTLD